MIEDPTGEVPVATERFPEALRHLLEIRNMSYRRLSTRTRLSAGYLNHLASGTRKIPSNQVIKLLAKALRVKPDHFREYRLRLLQQELDRSPDLADRLYEEMVVKRTPARSLRKKLENTR